MKYKFTLTQHLYSLNYFLKRHFALRLLEKFKRTFKQGKFFVLNVSNFNIFLFFFYRQDVTITIRCSRNHLGPMSHWTLHWTWVYGALHSISSCFKKERN